MKANRNLIFYSQHNHYRGCASTLYFSLSLLANLKSFATWQNSLRHYFLPVNGVLRSKVREPFIFSCLLNISLNCANGKSITLTKLW